MFNGLLRLWNRDVKGAAAPRISDSLSRFGCANAGQVVPHNIARQMHAELIALSDRNSTIHLHAHRYLADATFRRIFEEILGFFAQSAACRAVQSALGRDIAGIANISLFRRVNDPESSVPFRQDVSFLGPTYRVINFWIPLADSGSERPGLEVVQHRLFEALPSAAAADAPVNSYERLHVGETAAQILKMESVPVISATARAGEGRLFDQFCLHRTQPMARSRPRIALEMRMIAPEHLPAIGQPKPLFVISSDQGAPQITVPLADSIHYG